MSGRRLVMLSKSTWTPAIRREHALAHAAVAASDAVAFVERPSDVRSGARAPAAYLRGLRPWLTPQRIDGVDVYARSVVVPGHRSPAAEGAETALLVRQVRGATAGAAPDAVAVFVPWLWPVATRVAARRRIFDCADDWRLLMPGRERRFTELFARIAAEADDIITVSPALADLFPGRTPTLVRNGTSAAILGPPVTPAPNLKRMVYAGTLTDRFNVELLAGALERLPGWSVELYGQAQYDGLGEMPAPELQQLLERHAVRWHGVQDRKTLAGALDRADILIIPHRRMKPGHESVDGQPAWRGDLMKFYDYSARGRPIVSTTFDDVGDAKPPHLQFADTPAEFADAILRAAEDAPQAAADRRAWAAANSWDVRWRAWSSAAFG